MNRSISVGWRIPSFILSLGVLEMARGLVYQVTDSRTVYIGSAVDSISSPIIFDVSPAFITTVLVVIAGQLVLTKTLVGRHWIGIGTNEEAMRLAGINPLPSKIMVFALMGGRGSVVSTFIGVLIISVLEAGLTQVGVSEPMKRIITSIVILAVVVFDAYRRRNERAA